MLISQKSHYALRAVFELAKCQGRGPVKISAVANNQGIPQRFLEAILNQLKRDGIVHSVRGKEGGYLLAREPQEITVAEVLISIQGPIKLDADNGAQGPGRDVFKQFWKNMEKSITTQLQAVSIQQLVQWDIEQMEKYVASYSI